MGQAEGGERGGGPARGRYRTSEYGCAVTNGAEHHAPATGGPFSSLLPWIVCSWLRASRSLGVPVFRGRQIPSVFARQGSPNARSFLARRSHPGEQIAPPTRVRRRRSRWSLRSGRDRGGCLPPDRFEATRSPLRVVETQNHPSVGRPLVIEKGLHNDSSGGGSIQGTSFVPVNSYLAVSATSGS